MPSMNNEIEIPDDDVWPEFEWPKILQDAWCVRGNAAPKPAYTLQSMQRVKGRNLIRWLVKTPAEQLQEEPWKR